MPKGVTTATRFFLTKNEVQQLVQAGRQYEFPRLTTKYIDAFKQKNEDLRNTANSELVLLEIQN